MRAGSRPELTLVGPEPDPAYAAALRRQARDLPVHFAGQTDDVAGRLLAADVLLLPAGEVTPLVLMEAMALRTPVVAARMGSIPDVVSDDAGRAGDPEAMAAAVARLRDDPALAAGSRRRAGAASRRTSTRQRSYGRLSAEIARQAAGTIPLRRRLGGAWRQMRAAGLCAGGCAVAGARGRRTRLPRDVRHPAARGAGRAGDHRGGARAAPAAPAALVPAGDGVAAPQRDARTAARRADPDRGHVRRRPRQPWRVAAPLLRRLGCPATFFLTGRRGRRSGGSACRSRRTAASTHARRCAPRAWTPAPSSRSRRSLTKSSWRRRPFAPRPASSLARLIGEDPPAYRLTPEQVAALAGAASRSGSTRASTAAARARRRRARARAGRRRGALEAAAGRPLRTIAYPHGRADERVAAAARSAGYSDGFGGPERTVTARSDRLLLGRTELLLEEAGSFALALASGLWADR